ncbi:MAG: hypothetical protein QM831_07535 [Kofleriaceae bacterium]
MPGPVLTTASTITCTHGGRAVLTTPNRVSLAGAPILLESDIHTVVGCTLNSPCVTITWQAGANAVTIGGKRALVKTSIGQCKNGGGGTQGVALIASTQLPVSAR